MLLPLRKSHANRPGSPHFGTGFAFTQNHSAGRFQAGYSLNVVVVMGFPQPALRVCNVRKSFGTGPQRAPILRGVDMEVRSGETIFLVGPSGSGKTTLLSILGCILKADQGSVQVFGQEVTRMGHEQLTAFRRSHLGFIFQSFNLFPTLSALDNIRLTLCMRGQPLKAATAEAQELLILVGLDDRMHLRPGQLSTGECQRVAIARALADRPALLLADEPTASLDAENGQTVMHLLTCLVRDRGATLIVVTHDSRIYPFADRILRLEDGRLTGEWKPAELVGRIANPPYEPERSPAFLEELVA
jgi:putative ABC transport system ATP-binding protein